MTIDEFMDCVRTAFPVSAGTLTQNTRYKDLSDWNSMSALVLITAINERFNVNLSPAETFETDTLEDLYNIVKQR